MSDERNPQPAAHVDELIAVARDMAKETGQPIPQVNAAGEIVFLHGDSDQRAMPVGLVGIANMAPLVAGPRCVVDPPCGRCWYCRTWKERAPLARFTGGR